VLGSHGREGINKIVLGSKAEQLFRTAICPVLTVGPKVPREVIDFTILRRILFATDFSSTSLQALPYAFSLAEENQSCLMLLHLVPLPPLDKPPTDVQDSVRKRLPALVPPEATPWCSTEFLVRFEFPPSLEAFCKSRRNVAQTSSLLGYALCCLPGLRRILRGRLPMTWSAAHTAQC
jgi:hypothetical protein